MYDWGYHSSDEGHVHVALTEDGVRRELFDVTLYDPEVVDDRTGLTGQEQSLADLKALLAAANEPPLQAVLVAMQVERRKHEVEFKREMLGIWLWGEDIKIPTTDKQVEEEYERILDRRAETNRLTSEDYESLDAQSGEEKAWDDAMHVVRQMLTERVSGMLSVSQEARLDVEEAGA